MNILRVVVENPDELLNSSAFGAGALVRVEHSANGSSYAELSTSALVAGTTIYTVYHSAGTSSTYYRSRYSDSGGTTFSDYSDVWQVTTAPTEYATLHSVKNRLRITNTTDDSILEQITAQTNAWLENKIGFPVGPITSEERTFDGGAVRDGGYCLPVYPWGVRAITAVTTADSTGGSTTSRTASDVVIRPHTHERESGWPGFEIWVKDNASWTFPTAGQDVIGITGTWGWAAVPAELSGIADRVAIAHFRGRQAGAGATYAAGDDTEQVAADELSYTDWRTIRKYQRLAQLFEWPDENLSGNWYR